VTDRERVWLDHVAAPHWRKVAVTVIVTAIIVSFVIRGWGLIHEHWNSRRTDQSAYLRLGLDIRHGTALTDGNRHPLYPAILALFAKNEWSYFTTAKLLNLTIAVVTLLVVYWVARDVSNLHAAWLTVLLLSQTYRFYDSASKAIVEPLLTLVVVLTWFLMWRGEGSATQWGLAGVGAGLTYLAKGTGQIIAIVFLAASVLLYGKEVFRKRSVRLFLIGYVALASGLWVYNTLTYGNPFYNFSTTHAMWLDEWEERYVTTASQLPTALSYLRTHSVGHTLRRFFSGLVSVSHSVELAWLPWYEILFPVLQVLFLAVLVMKVSATSEECHVISWGALWNRLAFFFRTHRAGVIITALLLVAWYVLFAWYYPVSQSSRFFIPLAPVVQCGIASLGAVLGRLVLDVLPWPRGRTRTGLINVVYILLAILAVVLTSSQALAAVEGRQLRDPFRWDVERNAEGDAVLEWLIAETDVSPVRLLSGPGWTLPLWKYESKILHESIPLGLGTWEEFADFIHRNHLSWAIVDGDMVERRPDLLNDYFTFQHEDLTLRQPPPGWTLVRAVDGSTYDWYVFKTDAE